MTLATLRYISAIFNALYANALYVGIDSGPIPASYILASGQEILAENLIISLVLKSQRNVMYANVIL